MRGIIPFLLLAASLSADVVHYTYDDAGRLARVDYPSGASIIYTYDPAGNLLSRAVNGPSQSSGGRAEKQLPQTHTVGPEKQERVAKHSAL